MIAHFCYFLFYYLFTILLSFLFCCHRHRVRNNEGQLASLQITLAQQQEEHKRQSAQFSKEADAKVQRVKALQEEASELQRQLAAQRCKI